MCLFKKKKKIKKSFPYNLNFDYSGASFKEALLAGHVTENDIYDYIAYYNNFEEELGVTLGDFLGMSDNQYIDWITGSPLTLTEMFQADY